MIVGGGFADAHRFTGEVVNMATAALRLASAELAAAAAGPAPTTITSASTAIATSRLYPAIPRRRQANRRIHDALDVG